MNTIVFIVAKLSQPRCVKRIKSIIDKGYNYKVYGFEDGSYNTDLNKLPFTINEVFSTPKSSSFYGRIQSILYPYRCFRRIMKENDSNTVYYIFGYELAKIFYILGRHNIIYEEADINSAKIENCLRRKIAIKLDKKIALSAILTIYTSEGFVQYLFGSASRKPNYIIVPNKLSDYFDDSKRKKGIDNVDTSHLRFGFIGLIRYPKTIFRFAAIIADKYPQHEFHFFGGVSGNLKIPKELEMSKNIFFHGSFANPEDLEKIYSQIDVNIACYDASSAKYAINVKVAEPNKLYESIFFNVPLIVSSNTYVGKRVKELGVGTTIECDNDEKISDFIDSLLPEVLEAYKKNASIIPTDELIYKPQILLERINPIMNE